MKYKNISSLWLGSLVLCASQFAAAHGSVTPDEDLCVMKIGFYSAHFAIYQPRTRQHEEYCEDIPDVTESIFAIEYLHAVMREVPVDFRIIKDVQNRGRFVSWEDVEGIDDIEKDTVFFQSPITQPDGVFLITHTFVESGDYIGIVTARHPTEDKVYSAVFPFHVGTSRWGYAPLFIGIAVLLQANYWVMNGGYSRWRDKRKKANGVEQLA